MTGVYNGEAGFYDGLTKGGRYQLEEYNENQYLIPKNDYGATSTITKDKFVSVKEELLVAAERAIKRSMI